MFAHDSYDLAWNPYQTQRDQSARAHQRWLRSQAARARKRRPMRPTQPER